MKGFKKIYHKVKWTGYMYTEKCGIYNAFLQNIVLWLMIIIG